MENHVVNKSRIWELDFLRGIALILMIYFHIIYDLKEFVNLPISYSDGVNYILGKISAILFMLISGVCASLNGRITKRALKVLGIALAISIVTHIYNPEYGIKFGILHFLGISMLLSPLLSKIGKYKLLLLGIFIIALGIYVNNVKLSFDYLLPLGLTSNSFVSYDYYPLLPWSGIFLFGISLGKFIYNGKCSMFKCDLKDNMINKIGQKTLPIYLIHQPIIIAVIYLAK